MENQSFIMSVSSGVVNQSFKEEKDSISNGIGDKSDYTTVSFGTGGGKTGSVWMKVGIAVMVVTVLTTSIVLAVCLTGNCGTSE